MDLQVLAQEIHDGEWEDLFVSVGPTDVLTMSVADIHRRLLESCGTRGGPIVWNGWFDIYWTASWVKSMLAAKIPPASTVLEIGSGVSNNFVRAANSLLGSRGRFIGVNLNQQLTENFRTKNRLLPIRIRMVEDNALDVHTHVPKNSCVFVAFNHQINDIVQTIVYEHAGHTTDEGDWYTMVPAMVRLIQAAQQSGALESVVRPQFLAIIKACRDVLQPGGVMGFNNAVTPLLLRLGYTEELLGSFIPLARTWIAQSDAGLREVAFPGFDPHWWMFFQKS